MTGVLAGDQAGAGPGAGGRDGGPGSAPGNGPVRTRSSLALGRVLNPSSIAIVGLSDNSGFGDLVRPTLGSDAEVFFVNPRHDSVLGRPTVPTLTAIGRPVRRGDELHVRGTHDRPG